MLSLACESREHMRCSHHQCGCHCHSTVDPASAPVESVAWRSRMDWTPAEAYAYGRRDPDVVLSRNPTLSINECRTAVENWTAAQFEHAHTSFYGADRIRAMRAYWLGRLRTAREQGQESA